MMRIVNFIMLIMVLISCDNNSQRKEANNLNKQSETAINSKEYETAHDVASDALKIFKTIQDTLGIANSYYLMARATVLSGDFDHAVELGEMGNKFCKAINNFQLEYQLNNILGWAYYNLGRDFNETIDFQRRQLFVVDKLNDDQAKAMVYNNYGYDATVAGDVSLEEAIAYSKLANDHYAKTESNNGRWYTLMNLTWQHRLINDMTKSEEFGRLSVEQAKIDNDRHAIIEANTNLGETLLVQNKVEEAKPFYESAFELSKQKDDRDKYVFNVYYSRYLWQIGKKNEAIASLKIAIEFLKNSEIFYEMLGRAFLAEYSISTGNRDLALEQVNKFKNPRASFFSYESEVITCAVEAQLVSITDKKMALNIIDEKLKGIDKSGAELLRIKLLQLRDQM